MASSWWQNDMDTDSDDFMQYLDEKVLDLFSDTSSLSSAPSTHDQIENLSWPMLDGRPATSPCQYELGERLYDPSSEDCCDHMRNTEGELSQQVTHHGKDPMTDLPYDSIEPTILEGIFRKEKGWCFLSIPGCLYWISRHTKAAGPSFSSSMFKFLLDVDSQIRSTTVEPDDFISDSRKVAT